MIDILVVATMAEQWRILVVEGEENLNWNIVNTLQKDGYIVLGVTGGAEAIRTLWSEEYDVVICSQQMPDADGFDLLQWMRTYCPNTRMVMLGVSGSGMNRTQALEMGVASYLEKPLDMHALKEELRRLLHQTGFSASLDSFDLLDVIQIITMSRKSIALVVNTGLEEQGVLRFQAGELIWAEYGMLRGEEAFFALAAHKNGTVVHRPWNDHITPNVTQPLSRLIFQALQYRSKYAEYQQMSSEMEAIKPGSGVMPTPSALGMQTSTPFVNTLDDMEEDDTPFQFAPADFSTEDAQKGAPYEQAWGGSQLNTQAEPGETSEGAEKKAWWQPTGPFPTLQPSAHVRAVTDGEAGQAFPRQGSVNITPSTVHKTGVGQNNAPLPAWLTDQPTHLDLPVMRGSTGQMPAMPVERSPVLPKTPPTGVPPLPASPLPSFASPAPGQASQASAEWPAAPRPNGFNPADSGLRKINPEESMFTTPHRAVRQNGNKQPAPAEWQAPVSGPLSGQSAQMGAVRPASPPEPQGEVLQSLAALKRGPQPAPVSPTAAAPIIATPVASAAAPVVIPPTPVAAAQPVAPAPAAAGSDERSASAPRASAQAAAPVAPGAAEAGSKSAPLPASKRNYPALAAALQTVGYSVTGFVASAVVGLDGTPIAQVSVDETDISPMCGYLSDIIRGATQVIEADHSDICDHVIITSGTRHILLRLLSRKRDVFQVLITTRETAPVECLVVLTNVEAALVAAL